MTRPAAPRGATARSLALRSLVPVALAAVTLAPSAARAEVCRYTDAAGRTHIVMHRTEVPVAHRARAVCKSDPAPGAAAGATGAATAPAAPPRVRPPGEPAAGEAAAEAAAPPPAAEPAAGAIWRAWLEQLVPRGERAQGAPGAGLGGRLAERLVPLDREALRRLALLAFLGVLAARLAAAALAAHRAARLDGFVARLDELRAVGDPPAWPWEAALAFERSVPAAAAAVRTTGVGPAALAIAQEVAGGATDAGRRSVWATCATRRVAADAARSLALRARGALRRRVRALADPTSWLETVAFLPAWLVAPAGGPAAATSRVRLLVVLYWAGLVAIVLRG